MIVEIMVIKMVYFNKSISKASLWLLMWEKGGNFEMVKKNKSLF